MTNDLEESLKTVAKGAGIIFVGMIIGNLLGMLNQVVLGRFLGVEFYGQFNLALSLITIAATFSIFGLSGALARFIPFHWEKGERDVVKSTIRFSVEFILCTSISIGVIFLIFSEWLSTNIFHENNLNLVLRYLSIGLPLIALLSILHAVMRGFKAVKYNLIIYDVGMKLVRFIAFLPFILIGYVLSGAIIAYFVAMIFTIFTSFFIINKKLFPDHLDYNYISIGKKLLSFSWPLALTGITFLFISQTDIILLGYYLTSKDIGIYMPAIVIAQFLNFIGASFGYIFLPVISEFFAKGKTHVIESLFKSASKWMFLIALPVFLYILLFSKEIITLLYGSEYSKGFLALVIIAFGISMNVFTGLTGNILVGSGHTKLNLVCEVIAAITNVSLNIILIPMYGIIGAAIGTSASYFIRNFVSLAFVYKTNKIHPYKKNYVKIVISGSFALIVVYLIKNQIYPFFAWWVVPILLGVVLLSIYSIAILLSQCLDKNDYFILKAIWKKLG